jgi:hypothetical protein
MVTVPERLRRMPLALPRAGAIPLPDAATMSMALRRTTIVRLVLAALLLILTAFAVWRAVELRPRPIAFLDTRSTTVVVLDQSKSVYVGAYRRIAALLRALSVADAPVGLVAFSDTAYEMMPPGTQGSELKPLLRFYTKSRADNVNVDPQTLYPASPWQDVFSGGTKISAGLEMARSILRRDHSRDATIVLASDLETAGEDEPSLAQSLISLNHDHSVRLKILPLFPIQEDLDFFKRFLPQRDFIKPAQVHARAVNGSSGRLAAVSPWPLLVVGFVLLLALAANEFACGRLVVPRPQGASE